MSGEELKTKLQTLDIAFAEIARHMGKSQQAFQNILKSADVKSGTLEVLCTILKKDITFFYPNCAVTTSVVQTFHRQNAHNISNGSGTIIENAASHEEIVLLQNQVKDLETDKKNLQRLLEYERNDKVRMQLELDELRIKVQ